MNGARGERGSTVALAAAVALAAVILIGAATRILLFNSHQVVYFNAMNRAYRLAETGLIETMGRLAVNPNFYKEDASLVTDVDVPNEGVYSVSIEERPDVIESGYYFVTTATATVAGKAYSTRLHAGVRISNAAEYFWACNDQLILAQGTDASGGKVYAPKVEFILDDAKPQTKVYKAEFMTSIKPDLASGKYGNSGDTGDLTKRVLLTLPDDSGNFLPTKVSAVVFPQVLTSDLLRYKEIANNGQFTACNFTGAAYDELLNVYPPGYVGEDFGTAPDDRMTYFGSSDRPTDNKFHVWYCDGDLAIGNVQVFGQVIFAAEGNVKITGNIISDSNAAGTSYFPGANEVSSSTAHQAVIVTRGAVTVTKNFYPNPSSPVDQHTQTIEAMIMAPHGRLSGESYGSSPSFTSPVHGKLNLLIRGALIVGQVQNDFPHNFSSVFQGNLGGGIPSRRYLYMDSLKTNPPPFIPALLEIYFSYEETLGSGAIY